MSLNIGFIRPAAEEIAAGLSLKKTSGPAESSPSRRPDCQYVVIGKFPRQGLLACVNLQLWSNEKSVSAFLNVTDGVSLSLSATGNARGENYNRSLAALEAAAASILAKKARLSRSDSGWQLEETALAAIAIAAGARPELVLRL